MPALSDVSEEKPEKIRINLAIISGDRSEMFEKVIKNIDITQKKWEWPLVRLQKCLTKGERAGTIILQPLRKRLNDELRWLPKSDRGPCETRAAADSSKTDTHCERKHLQSDSKRRKPDEPDC